MKLNNITGRLTFYVLLVSIALAQVLAVSAEVCNLAADSEDIEFSKLTLW
jgi:hypothetical protein